MLKSGDVVGERYRLASMVAAGGMGAVWRAHHIELGVEVAVKLLLDGARTPTAERRFRQEAQAAARLRSPNVVHVSDFGVMDGQPFLVMELLKGVDLATHLELHGPMSPGACADILDDVGRAMQLAHDHGIIHRDLKPANIFLAEEAGSTVVKVLDFGIAKLEDGGGHGASTTGGLVGSPAYMSPEQVWAEPLTKATDLWSMGVVALEMLVGRNPFDDGPLARVFQRVVSDPLPVASALRAGLPFGLDAFFERCLCREPAGRFSSPLELARTFRSACDSPPREEPVTPATSESAPALATTAPPSTSPRDFALSATVAADRREAAIERPKRGFPRTAVVGAAALAALAALVWFVAGGTPSAEPAAAAAAFAAPSASTSSEPSASAGPVASLPPAAPTDTGADLAPSSSQGPAPKSTPSAPPRTSASGATPRARTPGTSHSAAPPPGPAAPTTAVDPMFGIPDPKR